MNEYLCTRALPYVDHECYGKTDSAARVPYYVAEENPQDAHRKMCREFPEDVRKARIRGIRPFTVKFHKVLFDSEVLTS